MLTTISKLPRPALQQGRYNWRHASALKILAGSIKFFIHQEARLIAANLKVVP